LVTGIGAIRVIRVISIADKWYHRLPCRTIRSTEKDGELGMTEITPRLPDPRIDLV
jgi:hypothetical protein